MRVRGFRPAACLPGVEGLTRRRNESGDEHEVPRARRDPRPRARIPGVEGPTRRRSGDSGGASVSTDAHSRPRPPRAPSPSRPLETRQDPDSTPSRPHLRYPRHDLPLRLQCSPEEVPSPPCSPNLQWPPSMNVPTAKNGGEVLSRGRSSYGPCSSVTTSTGSSSPRSHALTRSAFERSRWGQGDVGR